MNGTMAMNSTTTDNSTILLLFNATENLAINLTTVLLQSSSSVEPTTTTQTTLSSTPGSTTPQPIEYIYEMDLQYYATKADVNVAWVCCIFLASMILFSIVKTVCSNGIGVFDLRVTGISFPQRPELFVLLFSSIPTMISIILRPFIEPNDPIIRDFVVGWGWCQVRIFMDLFTRTASLTHMMYWNNRLVIIRGLFFLYQQWKERRQRSGADIGIPLQLPEFSRLCKRIIPAVIYFISCVLVLPSCFMSKRDTSKTYGWDIYNTSAPNMGFYAYYDHIGLVGVPILVNVMQFYYLALQADSKWKMPYRLRCYLVTFILLNIPLFAMLTCIQAFKPSRQNDLSQPRMASGMIICVTLYHSCFAIKPIVYTTGCNCICCGQEYLQRHPTIERYVLFWSTPQHKKKKDWEARHKIHKQEEQQAIENNKEEGINDQELVGARLPF